MWKSRCFDLVIDITVVNWVNVDNFVKRNTKAGCWKTLYLKPLVNVVGGIDNATIIKKIIAYVLHTPNEWLEIIHVDRRQEKLKFSPESNNGTKKQVFLINFCDCDKVKIECLKYLKHAVDLPINQKSQLTFLLNQFQMRDIQA